ncbi:MULTISPECIES: hypothetical protein [Corallococcus]|uniref:Lipoprotein n=3 Tax=Corallococcus TaxID=83461 RepID=H8MTI2_CORCM|nr:MULTISPECIES: hypothetical protein [Corallococcus]NOJ93439.1 hypothetical protein [Corallococcus coralloides]AFE03263.1 hypothetical protein COCOR_00088 [Corallococcus coralloides DSM 2259]MBN8230081.1 hypothetical protein [Corallococcus macrosporus]MBN9681329.1 hypothetical protein [Corallococcus sp. NCSPR001]NOK08675.1 hypothetical protein [Corallococcus exercitus]
MQARKNVRRIAFVLAAAATVMGLGIAATPSSADAQDCTPTCFKNPITGQITCTYPCP